MNRIILRVQPLSKKKAIPNWDDPRLRRDLSKLVSIFGAIYVIPGHKTICHDATMCYKYLNNSNVLERFGKVKNFFYFLNIIYFGVKCVGTLGTNGVKNIFEMACNYMPNPN
ncbi:MAG TPA: hypothetical protein DCY53_06275 [Desulfobacteraceae bacterium]|nr:hypothetical protein [Desulfobacteraceae bacterium]